VIGRMSAINSNRKGIKMEEDKKTEEPVEAAYEAVNIIDDESYIKLEEPKIKGFDNQSKKIDDINDTHSHNLIDYYRYKA